MKIFEKGFNYSQDGPGNRLVYHLQGCNFRCRWCSNPEGMGPECEKTREYSVDELVRECIRSKPMFFGGGGVTFTGGEATLQFDELLETLKKLKENNIGTAIETNGSHKRLPELSPYVDWLIMDVKHVDNDIHREYTYLDNKTNLDNFRILSELRPVHVRIPLVNHFNNGMGREFADFFAGCHTENCDFEILPYHEYGKCKYKGEYPMKDGFISDEDAALFKNELVKKGLKVIST